LGDPKKANTTLGWKPKHTFRDLVKDMVDCEKVAFETGLDPWAENN